jgi:hypothetical protein
VRTSNQQQSQTTYTQGSRKDSIVARLDMPAKRDMSALAMGKEYSSSRRATPRVARTAAQDSKPKIIVIQVDFFRLGF